jgi:hypothetical protein
MDLFYLIQIIFQSFKMLILIRHFQETKKILYLVSSKTILLILQKILFGIWFKLIVEV